MLKVDHLFKSYKTGKMTYEVLKDVCFEVKKGEFAAVMGASGNFGSIAGISPDVFYTEPVCAWQTAGWRGFQKNFVYGICSGSNGMCVICHLCNQAVFAV